MWVEVSGAMCVVSSMEVLADNMEFCSVYHGEVVARQCCDGYLIADISWRLSSIDVVRLIAVGG
jgi:hypothetical protein